MDHPYFKPVLDAKAAAGDSRLNGAPGSVNGINA